MVASGPAETPDNQSISKARKLILFLLLSQLQFERNRVAEEGRRLRVAPEGGLGAEEAPLPLEPRPLVLGGGAAARPPRAPLAAPQATPGPLPVALASQDAVPAPGQALAVPQGQAALAQPTEDAPPAVAHAAAAAPQVLAGQPWRQALARASTQGLSASPPKVSESARKPKVGSNSAWIFFISKIAIKIKKKLNFTL